MTNSPDLSSLCYDPGRVNTQGLADGLALLFDLDGVVIDSMALHIEAWKVYLNRHGLQAHSAYGEIATRMHGRRNDEIVEVFWGSSLSPEEVSEHGAAKESLFREMMKPGFEEALVPGVREFLRQFDHVPTGLGSNAEPRNIEFVLDGAGIRSRFDVIVDGHQVNRPKPFPDIYLKAAELLRISPANCIVFEDSPTGIEAARQAGARVVAVLTHPDGIPAVDLSIRDFTDPALVPWLQSLEPRG